MKSLTLLLLGLLPLMLMAQDSTLPHKLYLIPGQAGDARSFQFLDLDPAYEVEILEHILPEKGERMESYAQRMAARIDTTRPFSLVGVSLGGMVSMEMSKHLNPTQVILIASAKGKDEIPFRYKMLRALPLYKVFGGKFYVTATNIVRPLFEHDSKEVDDISRAMLEDLPPKFLKRAIHCIVHWRNEEVPEYLVHIHGDRDNTLPYKHIEGAICLEEGTHMMILTRAKEISEIINQTMAERLQEG
ncbi:MAG: alpha/beta hydrolase [Bacteroidota bacterium]